MGEGKRRAAAGDRIGDGPIEAVFADKMNALAHAVDELFNFDKNDRKVGFILMVFPFGHEDHRCNYISNADRKDVVVLLKEQLARLEGQPEMKGSA
jgi:hypothetical protein